MRGRRRSQLDGTEAPPWRIDVGGLCDRPASLGPSELRALGTVEMRPEVRCPADSGLDGSLWGGVPLAELARHVQPLDEARYAIIRSGPYAVGFQIESLERRGAILALTADGAELDPGHGGPVRLVVAKGACFDMVKAVDAITFEADGSSATAVTMVRRRHNFRSGSSQP